MSLPPVQCQADVSGRQCIKKTTSPDGMCSSHKGARSYSFSRPTKSPRFNKPIIAAPERGVIDENSGAASASDAWKTVRSILTASVASGNVAGLITGILASGVAGSASFAEARQKHGMFDLGANKYTRDLDALVPNLFDVTESATGRKISLNKDFWDDLDKEIAVARAASRARYRIPTHVVASVLEEQCNRLESKTMAAQSTGRGQAAELYESFIPQFVALAGEQDPAAAAEETAELFDSLPKFDEPVLKPIFEQVIEADTLLKRIVAPIITKLPPAYEPAVSDEQREAFEDIITMFRDTARSLREQDTEQ